MPAYNFHKCKTKYILMHNYRDLKHNSDFKTVRWCMHLGMKVTKISEKQQEKKCQYIFSSKIHLWYPVLEIQPNPLSCMW